MDRFCDRLRKCRQDAGLAQEDIARDLGIRYSTYGRYERGGSEPDISVAAKIADYFDVSLDYLAGRSDRAR
ncbi:MAG: helix-turn-helix transcriptional regulator [Oscillospiraceae bacterium]|nr:helix-turn-helix transcriptional regulator [Oscillospiraceae bacterium]